jgi:hypothetical protein
MNYSTRKGGKVKGGKNRDKKIVKLKIVNKKGKKVRKEEKEKSIVSLAKVLDLLLRRPIQVLVLMTGGFSMSLSLLKVGILDCVGKGAAHLSRQLEGKSAGGFFPLLSLV